MSMVVIISMVLCVILPTSWMPHAHILLVPTPCLTQLKITIDLLHMHIVFTKYHKGVPPCLLYKGPMAICFISTIGHPYQEDKENRYFDSSYDALRNSTPVILIRDLRIFVHAETFTMCHFCVHGFSWRPNVLL